MHFIKALGASILHASLPATARSTYDVAGGKLTELKPAGNASEFRPVILADTNRDGRVDVSDIDRKHIWTREHGAIFLPNIGDELHRCLTKDATGAPLSSEELAACNDASGVELINATLAAPLRTMPMTLLANTTTGRIYTRPSSALGHVRIFWKHRNEGSSSDWSLVQPELRFNASALEAGLTLAIDGRELVSNPKSWDGNVDVMFEVTDGNRKETDFVAMRQAPVLVHHHLHSPDVVVTLQTQEGVSAWQAGFVKRISGIVGSLSQKIQMLVLNDSNEVWGQDFMEPAYASMPGENGPVSIRVLLRSAQSVRPNGRRVFEQLRGPGVGGWQPGPGSGFGWEEINSGGNIETIPPYTSRSGVPYLNGRVLLGKHFDKYPAESFVNFLQAQGEQNPLILETGWLMAGHIDEIVQFLPSDNEIGFRMAVSDSRAALDILREMDEQGHGLASILSYNGDMTPDEGTFFVDPTLRNKTIHSLLSDDRFIAIHDYAQHFIDANIALLLQELPIKEEDVLRVPTLWQDVTTKWPVSVDGIPIRVHDTIPGERQLLSMLPSALNGLVLDKNYIAPKPWGPLVGGKDVFEEEIEKVYTSAGMNVTFIDDYMSHHVRGGEVHCGTNTLRDTNIQWWETPGLT